MPQCPGTMAFRSRALATPLRPQNCVCHDIAMSILANSSHPLLSNHSAAIPANGFISSGSSSGKAASDPNKYPRTKGGNAKLAVALSSFVYDLLAGVTDSESAVARSLIKSDILEKWELDANTPAARASLCRVLILAAGKVAGDLVKDLYEPEKRTSPVKQALKVAVIRSATISNISAARLDNLQRMPTGITKEEFSQLKKEAHEEAQSFPTKQKYRKRISGKQDKDRYALTGLDRFEKRTRDPKSKFNSLQTDTDKLLHKAIQANKGEAQ